MYQGGVVLLMLFGDVMFLERGMSRGSVSFSMNNMLMVLDDYEVIEVVIWELVQRILNGNLEEDVVIE